MKKLISMLLIACIVLGLCACGGAGSAGNAETTAPKAATLQAYETDGQQ